MSQRISDYSSNTAPDAADLIITVDVSDTTMNATGTTKKATLTQLGALAVYNAAQLQGRVVASTAPSDGQVLKWVASNNNWEPGTGSGGTAKGRVEILAAIVPTTLGAPIAQYSGASSPVEGVPVFDFVNGSATYRDFLCRLYDYGGGGLTLNFAVMRTSAAAAATYIFEAAIRRINTGTTNLGSSHTYDYNATTITVPAGPPAAGIPMLGTITFTNGSDMDSVANNDLFILRFRRNGGTATDTARVLAAITARET